MVHALQRTAPLLVCWLYAPNRVAGSQEIFDNSRSDFFYIAVMMIGIILFTVAFEAVTEWLEKALEDSPTYLDMVQKVYAELMILGFIAFVLTMFIEFGAKIPHHWLLAFEWAHLMIFAVAILYVANACLASWSMEKVRDVWHRGAMASVDNTCEELQLSQVFINSAWHKYLLKFVPLLGEEWRSQVDFKLIRLIFLHTYRLPQSFDCE